MRLRFKISKERIHIHKSFASLPQKTISVVSLNHTLYFNSIRSNWKNRKSFFLAEADWKVSRAQFRLDKAGLNGGYIQQVYD